MDERLNMSGGDIDRLGVIRSILDGEMTWGIGAQTLDLSERQIGRLCAQVRLEGNRGILHGLRGRPSNNSHDPELLGKTLSALHNPQWHDFGPVFCLHKLKALYGIVLGEGTVRKLMISTNLWEPHRRGRRHRAWRERRPCVGMLVQLDGSDHDWFEGRGPRCVLIIYIDDATSRILYGEFVHVEDTLTLMSTTRAYLTRFGRPVAFYVDKDGIYKVNRQATVEEELQDEQPMSQFTRAMAELGIEMIFAHSPQAKGRVERSFDTHQDRLVKELRLRWIGAIEQANRYLWDEYIPEHNARYAVDPADPIDVHKPLLPAHDLDSILSIQIDRQIQNDFTVRHLNHFFQLEAQQMVRIRRKAKLSVQQRLDGTTHIVFKGQRLKFHEIPGRPIAVRSPRKVQSRPAPVPKRSRHRPTTNLYAAMTAARRAPWNPPASAQFQT